MALALGIVAVAASAAYGITMDTKPGHKHKLIGLAPPPAAPAPAPPAPVPPAAATPPKPTPPAAPKAPAVKPPAAPPAAAHPPAAPAPATPPASSRGGGSPSGGSTSMHHNSGSTTSTSHSGTGSSQGVAGFSTGDTPYDAQVFDNGTGTAPNPGQAQRTIDENTNTAWTTPKSGVGIYVDAGGYTTYTSLGLVTKTPGYNVEVYATTQDPAPGTLAGGWTKVGAQNNVSTRQQLKVKQLPAGDARYYLILITKLPSGKSSAGIAEIALLQ